MAIASDSPQVRTLSKIIQIPPSGGKWTLAAMNPNPTTLGHGLAAVNQNPTTPGADTGHSE